MKRCLLFSLSLASCQAPEKAADVGRDAVAAEIKTEADKYLKFLFARDLEQWTALFKRDGFEMIINGNARESYEEVATAFGKNFEVWAGVEGDWDGTRVRVLSADSAVFRGFFHGDIKLASGETRHYPKVFKTLVYERTDSVWKVASIPESYDPASVVISGPNDADPSESGDR